MIFHFIPSWSGSDFFLKRILVRIHAISFISAPDLDLKPEVLIFWGFLVPKSSKGTGRKFGYYLTTLLAGGFKYFLFSSLFGEDEPILTNIFQMG